MAITYPVPGRGAWRRTGGLLPAKPGATSNVGYYRLATSGETPIGSAWLMRKDLSHHAYVVYWGVQALQRLVSATSDGWYGPQTDECVRQAQQRLKVEVDGIVGRNTMRALLVPSVAHTAEVFRIPVEVLGGILAHESLLDPAAVGSNGMDHGLAQINLGAHTDVTVEQALTVTTALDWTAADLRTIYDTWSGKTEADPWDIAVAHHNSPLLAKRWAISGTPPYVPGREFQIADYVASVRTAW